MRQVALGQALVRWQPRFLQRMREWIVADVVEQGGEPDALRVGRRDTGPALRELGEGAAGQMVGAERVLEAGVGGAGIHQKGVSQLPHVAQALDRGGIHHGERLAVQMDVVPERVANDLELAHDRGPASRTAGWTSSANCRKFCWNRPARFAAAPS